MSDFNIRWAREEDLDDICRMSTELAECLNESELVTITPDILRRDQQLYKSLVVEDLKCKDSFSKPLIGFALFIYKFSAWEGRVAVLDNIYVAPGHRSRGIGSSLLQMVTQDVADHGCSQMELFVHDWNSKAKKFYDERDAVDHTLKNKVHMYRIPISSIDKISKT